MPKVLEVHLALSLERWLAHHLQEIVEGGGLALGIVSKEFLDLCLDSQVISSIIHQLWWYPLLEGRALHDGAEPLDPSDSLISAILRGTNVGPTALDIRITGLLLHVLLIPLFLLVLLSSDELLVIRDHSLLDDIAELGLGDPTVP